MIPKQERPREAQRVNDFTLTGENVKYLSGADYTQISVGMDSCLVNNYDFSER